MGLSISIFTGKVATKGHKKFFSCILLCRRFSGCVRVLFFKKEWSLEVGRGVKRLVLNETKKMTRARSALAVAWQNRVAKNLRLIYITVFLHFLQHDRKEKPIFIMSNFWFRKVRFRIYSKGKFHKMYIFLDCSLKKSITFWWFAKPLDSLLW